MTSSSSPTKSRYSVTKSSEDGLAEWTSRIKVMQQQVDADEEDEQRKLEEEIAASRLARVRRSRGLGYGSRMSAELAIPKEPQEETTDVTRSAADRKQSQSDALQKLTGSPVASTSRPEPMSLASFMGGRATGPRLNRHAPQQDAHDPTKFEQRSRAGAPHPIFGNSAVAMPGMHEVKRDRRQSTPAIAPLEPVRERSISPQKTGGRERTLSTPGPTGTNLLPSVEPLTPRSVSPQKTGGRDRTMSTPSDSVYSQGLKSPALSSRPKTPNSNGSQSPTSFSRSTSSSVSRKAPVSPPSLARPVQPTPRQSLQGPQIPASQNPSPAFLKPPAQKDPTPSLSRLQGRGFVQNMVNVSKHLETSSAPVTPEKPVGKKSVLDRWPGEKSPPLTPPAISPKPIPMRKSRTVDSSFSPEPPRPVEMRPVKSSSGSLPTDKASASGPKSSDVPNIRPHIRPQHTPGVGSATTFIIFKPSSEETDFPNVDELGVRRSSAVSPDVESSKSSSRSELPAPGKPLAHPTKDRAKKPSKKTRDSRAEQSSSKSTSETSSTPKQASSPSTTADIPSPMARSSMFTSSFDTPEPKGVSALADRWSRQNIIGVMPGSVPVRTQPESRTSVPVGRRALPGMVSDVRASSPDKIEEPTPSAPSEPKEEHRFNIRHARIPSTGNRPTVMDVAQVLNDPSVLTPPETDEELAPPMPEPVQPPISPKPPVVRPQSVTSTIQSERRRSSYEKYSAIILPPLKEETTPLQSPAVTLSKSAGRAVEIPLDTEFIDKRLNESQSQQSSFVHIPLDDEPLPSVDIKYLLNSVVQNAKPDPDVHSISVEVISITPNANVTVSTDSNVFHDTERLAIVHRTKSKSKGLVATTVWGWRGKQSLGGEKEDRKLQDIARRYGCVLIPLGQYEESLEMVDALGSQLAIRQGTRAHWSADNTSMHLVRALHGRIFIDEVDLSIKNLCSGYSYCLSLLGTIYVWHGCGSLPAEQRAAQQYARGLGPNIVELWQGVKDENDEMFWMMLGDERFAQADYWKWRPSASEIEPKVWRIDRTDPYFVVPVPSFAPMNSVFIVDCVWELFVIVPAGARGQRTDIRLAISTAQRLAEHTGPRRPYTPPVHVLVLPSQIPIDLRLRFRDIDESLLNNNLAPDHMNLLAVGDALDQVCPH
ncbi:hypothetical protein C8J56DRAFT_926702 [Mycena floridula]|nr:hypothetical protein C8J56DRAFT_926702 [Mycena floridula]